MEEEENKKLVGKIIHYYGKIGVAVVELTDELKVGDEIIVEGDTTMVRQKVESMQVEHENIDTAKAGVSIGLKLTGKVHENDSVYKLVQ